MASHSRYDVGATSPWIQKAVIWEKESTSTGVSEVWAGVGLELSLSGTTITGKGVSTKREGAPAKNPLLLLNLLPSFHFSHFGQKATISSLCAGLFCDKPSEHGGEESFGDVFKTARRFGECGVGWRVKEKDKPKRDKPETKHLLSEKKMR